MINNINKYHYLILLLIISIFTGCSNAIKQARLDRFNNKLESNELKLTYRGGGSTKTVSTTDVIEGDGLWHHIVVTWDVSGDEFKL